MVDYFGDRLHMVADVHAELERLSEGFAPLTRFLEDWPAGRIRQLSPELTLKVAASIKVRQVPGQHIKEDQGETATVFYAEARRGDGEVFEVITDDGYGKTLARDRRFRPITSPSIVVQMVCAGALAYRDGQRVWQQCFANNRARWKQFRTQVEQSCPERVP